MTIHGHFHKDVSSELRKYVDDVALLDSRYMFVESVMRVQYGYCTHCRSRLRTQGLRHGQITQCQSCETMCMVKATGRGRKRLIDEACVVWYDKSILDPSKVTAICYYISRDFRGDFRNVETKFKPYAKYLFSPGDIRSKGDDRFGHAEMMGLDWCGQWFTPKSIYSERDRHLQRMGLYVDYLNVSKAVEGTPLQYSQWEGKHDDYETDTYEWRGLTCYLRPAGSMKCDLVRFF